MQKIGKYCYDGTGLCPECGEGLVPVPIFSGEVLSTNVRTDIQGNAKVRTTTKQYINIQPHYAGYCLACEKRAWEAREEEKAAKKPKPTAIIVWAVLLVASVVLIALNMRADGTIDATTPGGVLSIVGSFLSVPALIGVVWSIAAFVKENKLSRKYASGWREPFKPGSEETLSDYAADCMNKQPGDREYLSIEQMKRMNNPLYRG